MSTKIYLVRHGETLWNTEHRMQGHLNSDLTEKGLRQAHLLRDSFKTLPINYCYHSDSLRAIETANIITANLTSTKISEPRLREIHMGTWEGKTQKEIATLEPEDWHAFWETPHLFQRTNQGETFQELRVRTSQCLLELIDKHPDEHILLVSHRLTIKTMINTLLNQPLSQLNSLADVEPNSLSLLDCHDDGVEILLYSDTSHYN